jgi:hypothetical protein
MERYNLTTGRCTCEDPILESETMVFELPTGNICLTCASLKGLIVESEGEKVIFLEE